MDQEKPKVLKRCEDASEYSIHWEPGPARLQLLLEEITGHRCKNLWPSLCGHAGPGLAEGSGVAWPSALAWRPGDWPLREMQGPSGKEGSPWHHQSWLVRLKALQAHFLAPVRVSGDVVQLWELVKPVWWLHLWPASRPLTEQEPLARAK